jgi:hypothetical protein
MDLDFIQHRELENIVPLKLKNKEQYHLDLFNLEESWTGRLDALFSNNFLVESIQLIRVC